MRVRALARAGGGPAAVSMLPELGEIRLTELSPDDLLPLKIIPSGAERLAGHLQVMAWRFFYALVRENNEANRVSHRRF